ncbi:Zinc finger, PMZ-type [Parasponia andersonii]|uniref:Zinc finger, PMZ-type n=1 Tax=Parasponia andersonii TaxID=3476 RepID=A0A2P5A474_PARAD|nr:Zinc finger, PMZ-type [Parasponia andersonii]
MKPNPTCKNTDNDTVDIDNVMNGTIADYETDDEEEFKYLFVCLDALLEGWSHCRPVVCTIGYHQHQVIDGFVKFVVHVANKTYSCRKWELDLIPCSHTYLVINRFNLSFYSNVSSFFFNKTLVSTYDGLVHPVGNKSE